MRNSSILFNLEEIEEIIIGVGGCDASCDYDRGYDDACRAMIEVFEEKCFGVLNGPMKMRGRKWLSHGNHIIARNHLIHKIRIEGGKLCQKSI